MSKDMTQDERSQTQRPQSAWSHLYEESRIGKSMETGRLVVARGWTEGAGSDCRVGMRFLG